MRFWRAGWMAVLPMVLVQGSGCAHSAHSTPPVVTAAPPCGCGPAARSYPPAYPPPIAAAPAPQLPPGSLPPGPPVVNNYQPPAAAIQPQVTESRNGTPPPNPVETRPMPTPPKARLLPPEVPAPPAPKPDIPASPAETPDEAKPKAPENRPGATDFPPDIPQYGLVYDQVAAGLQPFPEGFRWLKDHGYRAVLFVRAAGEDDSAVRTEVEGKGMKYLTLEVSPTTLNRELVREFGRSIADTRDQPLFVFDRKGMLAGSLWYLHFRMVENQADVQAKARATRLGLKEDAAGEYADLWLAINQLLRGN